MIRLLKWLFVTISVYHVFSKIARSAWSDPITWTPTLVTVAQMNSGIRDNLRALKSPPSGLSYVSARDYSVAGLNAFTAIDTGLVDGRFQHTVALAGTFLRVEALLPIHPKVNNGQVAFNVAVNGVDYFPNGFGLWDATAQSANTHPIALRALLTGLTAGSNTIRLDWSATHTAFLIECGGVADTPAMFYVTEAP